VVGTGTILADDPELIPHDGVVLKNPLRVVVGERSIPNNAKVLDGRAKTFHHQSRDCGALVTALLARGINGVLVEAGSTLGTALFQAGLIDEIILIQAPTLLGSGRSFIEDLGIKTLADRIDVQLISHSQIGSDLAIYLKVGK
jgi:diaminohydroxyphosphoribosylaminopyrimidine deaminase/5-amino-6-(5-phosphoribosylamino)uracil reductase